MTPVAAIYTDEKRDRFFHASMSCNKWRLGRVEYKVNRVVFVFNQGKDPCAECWTKDGYIAEHDVLAGRG